MILMSERKFEKIIYFYRGKIAQELIMKIRARARKVHEHYTTYVHYEYYYYKDTAEKHHVFIVTSEAPTIEIIIDKNITTDEMVNELQKLNMPSVVLKNLISLLLDVPELQPQASEMIIRSDFE